uniref:Ras GTPase-activating protein-binding protein 2 n=1 Tax=Aotus nancymaae TaxID=37293 RepID=A0A2K5BUU6_AOTNA
MVMEKPSPLLVGREFVRQYYTLPNKAPEYLHRFYGRNSSYVHGGVDASGKPQEAVYGQNDIHHKVLSLNFSECHTKIRHVDAHATLSDGVVVQVMGLLSNSGQPKRKFMQTFILAPEGSVPNKFYVHNDIAETTSGGEELRRIRGEVCYSSSGRTCFSATRTTKPPRVREQQPREQPGFPPRGPRPGRGDMQQNDSDSRRIICYPDSHQLFVGNLPHDIDENELKEFFMSFGNIVELRINTKGVGGKLRNFGFVVFDDSEPVQRILIAKPIITFKCGREKTRAARERETRGGGDDRRDIRCNDRGPGGPRGIVGGRMMCDHDGRGPPPRGGMAQKLGFGRGTRQMEGRFTGQRR